MDLFPASRSSPNENFTASRYLALMRQPLVQSNLPQPQADCVVVGASFAGLACATVLARAGMRVTVLERKVDPGEKLHTTGIIVKDAIDQIALLDACRQSWCIVSTEYGSMRRISDTWISPRPATIFSPPIPRK
jgi:NAD(P)-binding Rossmann-like domain